MTNTQKQNKGFPCPECDFLIQPTIEDLLYEFTIKCPQCGLKLHMDRQESGAALQALQKLHVAIKDIRTLSGRSIK